MKLSCIVSLSLAALALTSTPSAISFAQTVDPALASSWNYMQTAMPGVPYEVLKAACAEGNLTLYLGPSTDPAVSQTDGFKSHFPCIKIQRLHLTTGQLRQRFLSEARADREVADITQDDDMGSIDKIIAEGLVMKYTITNDKSYPADITRSGYAYPLQRVLVAIAWNTSLVSDEQAKELTSWKGIINPAWANKSGVVDPSGGGLAELSWYVWPKLYGEDFIKQIGALKPRMFSASTPAAAALASGDIAVVFNASDTTLGPLWNTGAPIKWALPEPSIGVMTAQMIAAKAPHPNAAKLYQEYAFTLEGYSAFQKFGGAPSRNGFTDLRKVGSQPWYKFPTKFYEFDEADVTNQQKKINELVNTSVGSSH